MTRSSPPQTPHFDVSSIFSARLSTQSQFTLGIHSLTLATIMEQRMERAGTAHVETQTVQNMAVFTFLCFIFVVSLSYSARSIKLSSLGVRVTHYCEPRSHIVSAERWRDNDSFLSQHRFVWILYQQCWALK